MPTSGNVIEPSPHDRTRAYLEGGTRPAMSVLIAVGLVCLVAEAAGAIHLSSTVGPVAAWPLR
jgi:hypothetical protein